MLEGWERELLVARIVSGSIRCRLGDKTLIIRPNSRDDQYIACEVFADAVFSNSDLYDEDSLLRFMLQTGAWDEERQAQMEILPKNIEQFKVGLYQLQLKDHERGVTRKALDHDKRRLGELVQQRNSYNHLSCLGVANLAKNRYLIGKALHYPNSKPVFTGDDFWNESSAILDGVMSWLSANRVSDGQMRDLARTDPWRTHWLAQKAEQQLFGVPAVDLTEEQRSLLVWTTIYDNAFQHPEAPADRVVEDDDTFDGWMIFQRRKREQDIKTKSAEDMLSDRMKDKQEVFIPAKTVDEAKKIMDLNDPHTKQMVAQRFAKLRRDGEVSEMEMPDTKMRYNMEVLNKLKGKG